MMKKEILCILLFSWIYCTKAQIDEQIIESFIDRTTSSGRLEEKEIRNLFGKATYHPEIIERMERPAEDMPWYRYRKIFLTDDRIVAGVEFWEQYQEVLLKASYSSGVPAHIIVAIIGVESYYGSRMGNYKVLDALYTLAFGYPKRSRFFQSELEEFIVLLREEELDPMKVYGSYAGAIGYCQFMPTSYRAYAKSYDEGGTVDIVSSPEDAIASVANYLSEHRWKKGEEIASPVELASNYQKLKTGSARPKNSVGYYIGYGYHPENPVDRSEKAALIEMEQEDGSMEYWMGFYNFYVITRYNHSSLYALAVYQLGEFIKKEYN